MTKARKSRANQTHTPPSYPAHPRSIQIHGQLHKSTEGVFLLLDEGGVDRKMMLGVKNDKSKDKMAQTKLLSPPTPHTPGASESTANCINLVEGMLLLLDGVGGR